MTLKQRIGLVVQAVSGACESGLTARAIINVLASYIWDEIIQWVHIRDIKATITWHPRSANMPRARYTPRRSKENKEVRMMCSTL
eukprot:4855349-Amphidinium_carterae.1